MLYTRERAIFSNKHTEPTNTLYRQGAVTFNITAAVN
jgi:hypothetical protein